MSQLCHQEHWRLVAWKMDEGVRALTAQSEPVTLPESSDPLSVGEASRLLLLMAGQRYWYLKTFIGFSRPPKLYKRSQEQSVMGSFKGTIVVVLSPIVQIPPELEKAVRHC